MKQITDVPTIEDTRQGRDLKGAHDTKPARIMLRLGLATFVMFGLILILAILSK